MPKLTHPIKDGSIHLGLWLLRLTTYLPFPVIIALGISVGQLGYWLMPKRRAIAQTNIDLCFPNLSASQKTRLIRKTFQSLGISIFETALCWWGKKEKLEPLCHIEGLEHLQQAQQDNGILMLSAHFTSLEIGGRLLAMHLPFAVMYKTHRNPIMETVIKSSRDSHFKLLVRHNDLRGFISALKKNMNCWYAPDQDLGINRGVFAPFFGIPAATITAPSRFAKISGAKVVPFFTTRQPDNKGYLLQFFPALENYPSDDLVRDATRFNQIIEAQVMRTPEQYLWLHRRFKTRPAGEPDLYQK